VHSSSSEKHDNRGQSEPLSSRARAVQPKTKYILACKALQPTQRRSCTKAGHRCSPPAGSATSTLPRMARRARSASPRAAVAALHAARLRREAAALPAPRVPAIRDRSPCARGGRARGSASSKAQDAAATPQKVSLPAASPPRSAGRDTSIDT
jgi:hypothetical protein